MKQQPMMGRERLFGDEGEERKEILGWLRHVQVVLGCWKLGKRRLNILQQHLCQDHEVRKTDGAGRPESDICTDKQKDRAVN